MAKEANWEKDRLAAYFSLCTLYSVALAGLYLWGYWSRFHVNIFEYLGLSDVVKSVAIPLASALGAAGLGILLGELSPTRTLFPPGGGRDTPIGRVLNRWVQPIALIYTVIVIGFMLFAPVRTWLVLPVLIGVPIALVLDNFAPVVKAIPNARARLIATLVVATFLPLAYGRGVIDAENVAMGSHFDYVLSPIDGLDIPSDASPLRRARLLGRAGEYVFYLEPVSDLIAVEKSDSKKALRFKRFDSTVASEARPAGGPESSSSPASRGGAPQGPSSSPSPMSKT